MLSFMSDTMEKAITEELAMEDQIRSELGYKSMTLTDVLEENEIMERSHNTRLQPVWDSCEYCEGYSLLLEKQKTV